VTDHPQYPTGRQITDADLLAALMPDTPAGAAPTTPAPAPAVPVAPAAQPTLDVAALLELARRQGALEAAVTKTAPASPANSGPIVPRWAVGTAVASVGIGAGALLLGWALDLLAAGAAAVAAGITAAAPMLIVGAVLVVALLNRRKGGGFEVTQTITQTITQTVKGGGRR
jgi:hypothetical protein